MIASEIFSNFEVATAEGPLGIGPAQKFWMKKYSWVCPCSSAFPLAHHYRAVLAWGS